ncbi:hypothetical protein N7517_003691 [Penicillium concentricum]|uniref:Uncharacterized protein n=1 Tax=Penicillium concentricum TaxID=293559 RepID=A0A9W9S5E4_9EURO|nr:uncharacterized protein N7517_003691 [Penicillium concentricum]KAJ5371685.1 hypothetical protein N7517_003691 [Penicillium concentricum]
MYLLSLSFLLTHNSTLSSHTQINNFDLQNAQNNPSHRLIPTDAGDNRLRSVKQLHHLRRQHRPLVQSDKWESQRSARLRWGRAPVKYDIPCCTAAYTGTEPCIITTSTLSCWSPSAATPSTAASAASSSTRTSSTGVAARTSSHNISGSAAAPSTTEPPTQSKSPKTSEAGSANSSSSAPPVSANIATSCIGPLMAVAEAAIRPVTFI